MPDIPTELVLKIFHLAASTSTTFSFNLCLVSSWTYDLALPYLYKTVLFDSNSIAAEKFRDNVPKSGSSAVKNLCIYGELWKKSKIEKFAFDIFSSCENVVNLALSGTTLTNIIRQNTEDHGDRANSPTSLPHDKGIHLTLLLDFYSECLETLVDYSFGQSKFHSLITHLRLDTSILYFSYIEIFSIFPNLTHLALPFKAKGDAQDSNHFGTILRHLPSHLRVFVTIFGTRSPGRVISTSVEQWFRLMRQKDSRTYFLLSKQKILHEWKEEAEGNSLDIWSEAIVHTRRWESDSDFVWNRFSS